MTEPGYVEGQVVAIASRLIGRGNIAVGTIVRSGSELRVGPLLLWHDRRGSNRLVRVIAIQASSRPEPGGSAATSV